MSKKYKIIISSLLIISLLSIVIYLSFNKSINNKSINNTSVTSNNSSKNSTYLTSIFNKDKVMEINIEIDEDAWQTMLDTAVEENYTSANITINGKTYNNVAIRPKGNSSLSQIYNDATTDRYSFKIKFDKYVDGQTLDGLSKLVLNNCMSDTTYMKEYLSYDLLSFLNVPTPAYSFANITVNGEEWGLYLAVEPIEEEFIERYYGDTSGNLYKPESDSVAVGNLDNKPNMGDAPANMEMPPNGEFPSDMQMPPNGEIPANRQFPNNGNIQIPPDGQAPSNSEIPMNGQMPNDIEMPTNGEMPNMNNPMPGGMNKDSDGANLVWNGDDIENYSAIFDNAEFKDTDTDDYQKILDMIEHLHTLDDIESYLNVDEVLRYFAANTFLVNLDSYASNMKHNYYLYEEDGIVSILPWDYNLSFGAFQGGDASNVINFPIDSPVTDSLENSPLIGKLLEVDEYKELYHKYLNEIVENYINNGVYKDTINKINSLISSYVENDATAFYTFDEYTNSLTHLINFGYDRANSISAQLAGSQPTTTTGTIETTVDLKALGQQGGEKKDNMMNKFNGGNFTPPNFNNTTNTD